MSRCDTFARVLATLVATPPPDAHGARWWATPAHIHEQLRRQGFKASKRTTERDLWKLHALGLIETRDPDQRLPIFGRRGPIG